MNYENKLYFGVSSNEHDAAIAVTRGTSILFASHSERYSRKKNDPHLCQSLVDAALEFGQPDKIIWFERPWRKRLRKLYAGQPGAFAPEAASYLRKFGLTAPVVCVGHHEAHAAGGFFTSPFSEAAILVVDAIGEWTTLSAWYGNGHTLTRLWSRSYPHSLGLLYSAFTQRCGFKPNEEEYILMGMAAYGKPIHADLIREDFVAPGPIEEFRLRENVHRGIGRWRPDLDDRDVAASIQAVTEDHLLDLVRWLSTKVETKNLVIMGGVALNCVANSKIARDGAFENIWIMPNPGDAGSALGAVAAYLGEHLEWHTPFLGHRIERHFEPADAIDCLLAGRVIGIANGRAEFGPRALGNRSLLCDPRGPDMKDRVNLIKKRELFRPFAPVILQEHARDYFDMPVASSPYMQFVAPVKRPDLFPAITHVDGTARVQTLTRRENPNLHALISAFYEKTGCPMLLNTSLNIKGEPLVNTWEDAVRFRERHDVPIF